MVTNPFTVIQRPRSWSPPLCRLVLWNRVLEPSLNIRVIRICNFRLRVYTFLLVFFDSLAGKAFLARSIKLCLVDNQWSSGVMVAGFESCWFEAGPPTLSSPQIEFTNYLSEDRAWPSSIGIRALRFTARYNPVCPRFIFVHYLQSTKSPKNSLIFRCPITHCALQFRFQFCFVQFVSVVESSCWFWLCSSS